MKFSLSQYLTEKLQSQVIIDDLLNDKGGLCKLYKVKYDNSYGAEKNNHMFDRFLKLYDKLDSRFCHLFNVGYRGINRPISIHHNRKQYDNTSNNDDLYQRAYDEYMKLYKEYVKIGKQLFTKPSSEVLKCILGNENNYNSIRNVKDNYVNLSNISDDMFEKYTYQQVKNDKALYDKLCDEIIPHKTVFWMRADKTILAVSYEGEVRLEGNKTDMLNQLQEIFANEDNYPIYTHDDILQSGEVLKWPVVKSNYDISSRKHDLILIINSKKILFANSFYFDTYKPGKFLGKASKIYKETKWGSYQRDYLIVFNPMKTYKDENRYYDSDYSNYLKQKLRSTAATEHKADVEQYVTNRFKWTYDLFGDVYPYGGTKSEKTNGIYKFMSKFNQYSVSSSYQADEYCVKMHRKNMERYDTLKTMIQAVNEVNSEISPLIEHLKKNINDFVSFSRDVTTYISFNKDKVTDELNDIVTIYSGYSFALNDILAKMGSIYTALKDLQYSIDKVKDTSNTSNKQDLSNYRYNIDNYKKSIIDILSNINPLISALNNAKKTLDEMMGNK